MAIVPLLKIDHNLKEPRKNLIVLWSISRCKINYFSYFIPLEFFVVMGKEKSQIKQKGDGTIRHCGIRPDLSACGIVWLQLSVTPPNFFLCCWGHKQNKKHDCFTIRKAAQHNNLISRAMQSAIFNEWGEKC